MTNCKKHSKCSKSSRRGRTRRGGFFLFGRNKKAAAERVAADAAVEAARAAAARAVVARAEEREETERAEAAMAAALEETWNNLETRRKAANKDLIKLVDVPEQSEVRNILQQIENVFEIKIIRKAKGAASSCPTPGSILALYQGILDDPDNQDSTNILKEIKNICNELRNKARREGRPETYALGISVKCFERVKKLLENYFVPRGSVDIDEKTKGVMKNVIDKIIDNVKIWLDAESEQAQAAESLAVAEAMLKAAKAAEEKAAAEAKEKAAAETTALATSTQNQNHLELAKKKIESTERMFMATLDAKQDLVKSKMRLDTISSIAKAAEAITTTLITTAKDTFQIVVRNGVKNAVVSIVSYGMYINKAMISQILLELLDIQRESAELTLKQQKWWADNPWLGAFGAGMGRINSMVMYCAILATLYYVGPLMAAVGTTARAGAGWLGVVTAKGSNLLGFKSEREDVDFRVRALHDRESEFDRKLEDVKRRRAARDANISASADPSPDPNTSSNAGASGISVESVMSDVAAGRNAAAHAAPPTGPTSPPTMTDAETMAQMWNTMTPAQREKMMMAQMWNTMTPAQREKMMTAPENTSVKDENNNQASAADSGGRGRRTHRNRRLHKTKRKQKQKRHSKRHKKNNKHKTKRKQSHRRKTKVHRKLKKKTRHR